MIKIACSGFPIGKTKYESKLRTVELTQLFDAFPRPATINKWRNFAPRDFEFLVCASRLITHPRRPGMGGKNLGDHRIGHFQDTPEVKHAFLRTLEIAEALHAKIVVFQCPRHFSPNADNIGRLQTFFRSGRNQSTHFVWEPPPHWPTSLVETLSRVLHITPAMNPLNSRFLGVPTPFRYYRLGANGHTSGVHRFSDIELRAIKSACDRPLSYVIFNNGPTAFSDALRLSARSHV